MRKLWILILLPLLYCSGCGECDCIVPDEISYGTYIGPFTYIYQGKNPVDGAFYSDTTYLDTFAVTRLVKTDSIRFRNGSFSIDFKYREDQYYQAGPYTTYRLTETDSMYYDSYFYSGTDADHFYSESFSFRGKKK